jgi:hypothetical protein
MLIHLKSPPGKNPRCAAPRIAKQKPEITDTGDIRGDGEGFFTHCEDLRTQADDLTADTRSISNSSLLSRRSLISFGSVSVHTHPVTLGDNPAVSKGIPVTLDWKYVSSQCFDIDEYERMCQGRRKKAQKIDSADREAWLREKGYTRECLNRVWREISEIKASRRQSRGTSGSNAEPTNELEEPKKDLDPIEEYLLLANATRSCRRASNVDSSQGAEKKSSHRGSKTDSSLGSKKKSSREEKPLFQRLKSKSRLGYC